MIAEQLSKRMSEEQRKNVISDLVSFDTITRAFITSFVRTIEVGGDKQNRVINIYWKF